MPPKMGCKKKKNFSSSEVEILLNQIKQRKHIIFQAASAGVTGKEKIQQWQHICDAVNTVSAEGRTLMEIKKKWFDLKLEGKKRFAQARRSMATTGGGQPEVTISPIHRRIQEIIGQVALTGVKSDSPPDDYPSVVSTCEACYTSDDPQPGTSGTQTPTSDDNKVAQEQGSASAAEPESPRRSFSRTQVESDAVLQGQEQILSTLQLISTTLIKLTSVFESVNDNLERINETLKSKSN